MPLINTLGATSARAYGFGRSSPYLLIQSQSLINFTIEGLVPLTDGSVLGTDSQAYSANLTADLTSSASTYYTGGIFRPKRVGSQICAITQGLGSLSVIPASPISTTAINFRTVASISQLQDCILDSSGNLYAVGFSATGFYIIKYNSSFVIQWQKNLAEASTIYATANISINNAGDVILCVYKITATVMRTVIMKLSAATAAITWQREITYTGVSGAGPNYPLETYIDSADNIYVLSGFSYNSATITTQAIFFSKYNTSGTNLAFNIISPPSSVYTFGVNKQFVSDGTYFYIVVAIVDGYGSGQNQAGFLKVAMSDLSVSSFKSLTLTGGTTDGVVAYSPFYQNGNVYLVGKAKGNSFSIFTTVFVKMSVSGNILQNQTLTNVTIPNTATPTTTTGTYTISDFSYVTDATGLASSTPAFVFTTPANLDAGSSAVPSSGTNYTFSPQYQLSGS